ncbi:carotenoid 1,2-hydratase [Phenylobacterium sp.]|uniref:lipocalin-like domain-containing protein n=1 Tax=Phenylobacterium sp. TaxID=1871053 RepID=UPI002C0093C5|nr:carotenoid 1,2-hydratase [Phenylobacterium sp.]HVI33592.1 carotenoid 1,2-hydratase [Phenylobacterium sp.]
MRRHARRLVLMLAAALLAAAAPGGPVLPTYAPVRADRPLVFPRDHGAHPEFRTEWWYVTGWLETPDGRDLGFQVTFFRSRLPVDQRNPSAFAPKQILFAHAALSDPRLGRLLHEGRIARQGLGLAQAAVGDADVTLLDWRLARGRDDRFTARAGGKDFALDLAFVPTQPVLLQGQAGFSRKGPRPGQASYYYSQPQLSVSGSIVHGGRRVRVTGRAWLDHEWSSTLLDPRAVGWDWVGLNLEDGGALTAFQVRDRAGRALWAGGSLRSGDGTLTRLGPEDVRFRAERLWRSPATGGRYPVQQEVAVTTRAGVRRFRLTPLFDNQELDSRRTGGPVYWEGAVSTVGGRGYLELTGYVSPLSL